MIQLKSVLVYDLLEKLNDRQFLTLYWAIPEQDSGEAGMASLTVEQYSCIGWVSLCPLAFLPVKKHVWQTSKLKHRRHRYLERNGMEG